MNHRPSIIARIILLTLLFAVQSMSFAHEIEHVSGGGSGSCAVCITGGSLGHAVVDCTAEPLPASPETEYETVPADRLEARALPARRARAPPLC